jgi:hypothetical protein
LVWVQSLDREPRLLQILTSFEPNTSKGLL